MTRNDTNTKSAQGRSSHSMSASVVAAVLLLHAAGACSATPTATARALNRVMPPDTLECGRDQLTSYTGIAVEYAREPGRTRLVIHTDWQTVETVILEHAGSEDPSAAFLWSGRPFTAEDWARVEIRPGVLRRDVRVTAWICEDGVTPPVIDWQATR